MLHLLAQTTAGNGADSWTVVLTLGVLVNVIIGLGVLVRMLNGKGSERQVEPTQISALQSEMRAQTITLNHINREVGEVRSRVEPLASDVQGLHQRIGGISRDLAGVAARVDGLEKREGGRP